MTQFAAKNGLTVIDEGFINSLFALQPFSLVYEGVQRDANTGSGVAEFDNAGFDHAIRFTATGTTEVGRVEFNLLRHGAGADLAVEVRSGFNPDGSTEGILHKRTVLPLEFIPAGRSFWSIPVALTGLTAGTHYWLIVRRAGDATNHFHLHGEASQNASYPCHARAGAGAWTLTNAVHFRIFSGTSGLLRHEMSGNGSTTMEYDAAQLLLRAYFYLPPPDGSAGGIRNIMTFGYQNNILTGGAR